MTKKKKLGQSHFNQEMRFEYYSQLFLALALGIGSMFVYNSVNEYQRTTIGDYIGSAIAFIILLIFLFFPLYLLFLQSRTKQKKYIAGRYGENKVFKKLESIPGILKIYKNLRVYGLGDIDCIVVTSSNILLFEIKNISGNITANLSGSNILINGQQTRKNYVNQTYRQAKTIEKFIGVKPVPILVYVGRNKVDLGYKSIKGVYVIGYNWIENAVNKFNKNGIRNSNDLIVKLDKIFKK